MSDLDKKTTVEGKDREFNVSTVRLPIKHGDYWFETCLFWNDGSYVLDRYKTESEAIEGHEQTVEAIDSGEYTLETRASVTGVNIQ